MHWSSSPKTCIPTCSRDASRRQENTGSVNAEVAEKTRRSRRDKQRDEDESPGQDMQARMMLSTSLLRALRVLPPRPLRFILVWLRVGRAGALPLLSLALFAAVVMGAAFGAVPISPLVTAQVLLNATHLFHFHPIWPATDEIIVLQLRLPRVLGAALVGAALATAGTLFQWLLRNPLADPLLLGTSSGAALGPTIAFLAPAAYPTSWLGL